MSPAVPLKLQIISATLGVHQLLCPDAASSGRFYRARAFLPSDSEATNIKTSHDSFHRAAVSLQGNVLSPLRHSLSYLSIVAQLCLYVNSFFIFEYFRFDSISYNTYHKTMSWDFL